ncbi:MAG TPA: Calx-beta domain-containing protein, partial [Pyrinomonadaceae bacterium]
PNPGDNSSSTNVTVTATPLRQKTNGLIAYSADRIYTAKADASQAPTLFPGLSSAYVPRWSPDGAKLAFIVSKFRPVYPNDLYYELQTANADGTGLLSLADNLADVSTNFRNWFTWSPDGTRLAYIGKDTFIYIANADGSGFSKLPNSPSQVRDIDWSADGSRFVLSKDFGEIYVMNIDGSELTKLVAFGTGTDGQTHYVGPRWSPDMSKILYTQVSNNYTDVFIMNSDGTGARRLLNNFTSFAPAWSPDGAKLAFYQSTQVHVVDLDGSNEVTLTTNEGCCNIGSISWQPIPTNTPLPPPAPTPQTFTITGHVITDTNFPLGATVTLGGTRNATIQSKFDGQYEFVNLPAGGNYTITVANVSYNFTPASRVYNNLGSNQTGADFVGTYIPANITGRITDTNGNPLSGIKVTSSGGFPQGSTFTDANGFYSFPNVQRFRTYFIFPDPFTVYNFAPQSYSFSNLMASQVADFVGTKQPSNIISGRVIEYGSGHGLSGIQVSLGRDGNAVTDTFTDINGNFSFGERPSNHQYSISIPNHPTYVFEPTVDAPTPFAQIIIPNLTSDQNVTFTGVHRNTLQFTLATPFAGEGDGRAEVFVTRSGDIGTAASVNYSTANGTASQASDYTIAVGTLKWAAGDASSRNIRIILTDDAYVEGTETFTLTLDSPVGAQLGTTKVATINITDNDATPASANPIDDARFFVRQNYADFLSREPDQGGLDYWTERITQCGSDIACINFWRSAVSAAFFIELEFQNTGSFVYRLYKESYGTRPTYGQFTPDRARVVDSSNPEQSKQNFALLFVQRPAFTAKYAPTLDAAGFVDALLQTVQQSSQVDLTGQRDALLSAYNTAGGGINGRATVLRQTADNAAYAQAEYNKAFVLMQYFGFLKRNPDDGGYQFWLNVVNNSVPNDPSGYRSMVCAFITSPEYQQRFSGIITRNDTVCAPQ